MWMIGCDWHTRDHGIAAMNEATGELPEAWDEALSRLKSVHAMVHDKNFVQRFLVRVGNSETDPLLRLCS